MKIKYHSTYSLTTQAEVRMAFWADHPQFTPEFKKIPYTQDGKRLYRRKTQNEYCVDIRCAFVDYVDNLAKNGTISAKLASRVTL